MSELLSLQRKKTSNFVHCQDYYLLFLSDYFIKLKTRVIKITIQNHYPRVTKIKTKESRLSKRIKGFVYV